MAIVGLMALGAILAALALLFLVLPVMLVYGIAISPWLEHTAGLLLVVVVAICVALVKEIL